ncbi:MAG TPA: glycosyltransferase family 39 protein [Geobacteraceae bacterium]|nr:glycosyltransferase family 39 protein [Geobacteraceae bacterium]
MQLSKKNLIIILLVIIAAGLVLRLLGLVWGHGYYQTGISDDMEAFRSALSYLEGDAKAQYLGQPHFNSGKVPGPLWAMLWSLPLRFGGSPVTVILMIILLNVATIPLVYLLARRLFGQSCALWTTLFYAVSPWPVYFSVSCNNPSAMAMLGVLLFLALWDVCSTPRSANIFWVCVLLAALPHFHMVGVFYVPFVLLVIILSGSGINRKWLAAGILAAVVIYIPYVFGEMSNHWENTRQILSGKSKFQLGVIKVLTSQVNVLSNVVSRWTGHHLAEYRSFGDTALDSFYVLTGFNLISVFLGILFLGNFIRDFFRRFRGRWFAPRQVFRSSPSLCFTGILLFGPVLLFVLTGHDFTTRYLCVQLPLLFCLPALFLGKIPRMERWRAVLAGGLILTTTFNLAITPVFFRYQKSQIERAALFVPTLPGMEALYRALRADTPPDARILIQWKDFTARTQGDAYETAKTIAKYISMRDELYFLSGKSRASRTYLLEPACLANKSNVIPVFQCNGIRLISAVSAKG